MVILSIVLCALGDNNNGNGTVISECITSANDLNTSLCSAAPQSENATMAPMNFTIGENSTFVFTTTLMFTDIHIALVDFEGNFLNGLSTNQTNIEVIDVCGVPTMDSLTNLSPLNQTDNVTFDLIVTGNMENVTIRIFVFFDILNSTNCTWEAWNFTITALNNQTVCPYCPCPQTVPSTQPQTLTNPQPQTLTNPQPNINNPQPSTNLSPPSTLSPCPPCPCLDVITMPLPAIIGPIAINTTVPEPAVVNATVPDYNVTHVVSVNASYSNSGVGVRQYASFICTLLCVSLSLKFFL